MHFLKTATLLCFLALSSESCYADVAQARALYQAILSEKDETRLPSAEFVRSQLSFEEVQVASTQEIQSLLPLARECLHSSRPFVRAAGMHLFLGISMRLDSGKFLETYVDDLALLLDDPDQGIRGAGILILGNSNPAPSPKVLTLFESRVSDQSNSDGATGLLAGAILKARGAAAVPAVLAVVAQRPSLKVGAIQALGGFRITSEPALKFLHTGFLDPIADTRRVTIDAVANLPPEARKGFQPDLLLIMQNPDEDPRVVERARQVYLP